MGNSTLKSLTQHQVDQYWEKGYVANIDVFSAEEVTTLVAELNSMESTYAEHLDKAGRNNAHYVLRMLDRITHEPRILDAVEDVIGANILVAGTTLFIKEPQTQGFISWHQDARYIGLEPHDWVTAWVALSDVTLENGCVQMIPGSHKSDLIKHTDTFGKDNLLTRGQTVPGVDESQAVPVEMKAGQLSLHHPRIIHGSGPNLSGVRRLGFAIQSFIAPNVEQVLGKIWVQLARGIDEYGHHELAPRPQANMSERDLEFRDRVNEELAKIFYSGSERTGKY